MENVLEHSQTHRFEAAEVSSPKRPLVLVLGDDSEMQRFIAETLDGEYRVTLAADWAEALSWALAEPPDLVITDLMIPGMGDRLTEEMRLRPTLAEVPVLVLSEMADEALRIKLLAGSVQDYIVKPFSPFELRVRTGNLVRMKRTREMLQKELSDEDGDLSQLAAQLAGSRQALVRAQEELRRSEQHFRLVESIQDYANFTLAPDGIVTSWNVGAERIKGYKADEIVGRHFSIFYLPEDVDRGQPDKALRLAAAENRFEDAGWRVRKDGSRFWANVVITASRDTQGQLIGFSKITRDLTDRKRTEEALRVSEERFRRYFDLGLIGMAITSPTKGCLEVNDELCRVLGYERSELLQKTWAEITHPDDLEADVAQFERVLAGEIDGYTVDKRWIGKDGQIIDSIMAAKCMRRPDHSVDYFVGLVLDTTERKRAEEALRRSEAQLVQAQKLSHTGSWTLNLESGNLYWSEEHFRIVGLEPQTTVPGYPVALQVIHPEDRSFVQRTLETSIRNHTIFEVDCRIVRPDGTVREIHSLGQPAFERTGVLTDYIGAIVDVTERKEAEAKLHKSLAELAHIVRLTTAGEITASIAHEVNQPLAAILNNANACRLMLEGPSLNLEEVREAVADIAELSTRAAEVISGIRAFLGKSVPGKNPLGINLVVQEVISLVVAELEKHKVSVHIESTPGLARVLGDRIQLQQVVLNLIINAIDAMSSVTERPRELWIRTQPYEAGSVLVSVRDSGIGLDPSRINSIFDAFVTTKPSGLGMGLAICRSIIEAHDGRMWARPNESYGATFQFTLPACA